MNKINNLLLLAFLAFFAAPLAAQQFFFSPERPASCSSTDGIVTIVPMRGVPPFTYQWSNGSTDLSIHNVGKGVYSATLTDATGATVSHTHYLNTEEFDLTLVSKLPVSQCNATSGAINIAPENGTAPFTYSWSNGATSANNTGLAVGTYTVTVTDANGCVAQGEYTVDALPFQYYFHAQVEAPVKPNCTNPAIGELSAYLVYSSYAPYTYAWSNGATGVTVSGLATGNYTVTVTDALGCTTSASINLKNDLSLTSNVICDGGNSGMASALLVNGQGTVNYVWSNGQTGANQTNLTNGAYFVTATDANGCSSDGFINVVAPSLTVVDYSPKCYSGNNAIAYAWVNNDQANSFLWDNGDTGYWSTNLSSGLHSVTVTTALGCTLTKSINLAAPLAPAFTFTSSATPADCSNNIGGALNLSISGGISPYTFYAYGPGGFFTSDINSLQNVQGGDYQLSVVTNNMSGCYANTTVSIPDAGGFEPELVVDQIDCSTGLGSAAVVGVTTPGAQYSWSNGASGSALFNLTEGLYSVTVSAGASCNKFYEFYLYSQEQDSLQTSECGARAEGKLINDLGVAGCTGTQGIPYQLIRTLPTGALSFTDVNGNYSVGLGNGTYQLEPANYDLNDIACPVGGQHTVAAVVGTTVSGLDFHYLNNTNIDNRVRQRALRTAQPGYPYSLRLEVCNDGSNSAPGTLDLDYGNFLGPVSGRNFPQHIGAFALAGETSGSPENTANFTFPGVTPGTCELLQLDLLTPVTTPVNTSFKTEARVSPTSNDPTPTNNVSNMFSTVMGSFDPNCVLAFPARNGNPRDGGQIFRYEDNTIVYQIFFQNTGNAPADLVVVRDPLDENLDLKTIRNITSTHNMKVLADESGKTLTFKFENINLPDSLSDYAGSIGSIQYEINLKPGLALGTEIKKQASIFFDFNAPVITNNNVLELASATGTYQPRSENSIVLFPNPADASFAFHCDAPSTMTMFNATGALVATRSLETGLQQVITSDLPNGIYLVKLDTNGKIRNGKIVVNH